MELLIATITLAVPTLHFWLHAMLKWWKKFPISFYLFSGLIFVGSFFIISKIEQFSPQIIQENSNLGAALIIFGIPLIAISILTLGPKRFFMWAVLRPQKVNQKLIKKGIFHYFPHPAYIGYLLMALGNLLSNGTLHLASIFIFSFVTTPIMIYFEEQELKERLGPISNPGEIRPN